MAPPLDPLDDLNPAQRDAVVAETTPLVILAGAGSGKTRVLTRRIAWQVGQGRISPRHCLAVTFTRKAAGELTSRLGALGLPSPVTAGTFHGLAYSQLRRRWADRRETEPRLLERKVRLLVPMLPAGPTVGLEAADVAAEIEWAKARLVTPDGYEAATVAAARPTPRPAAEVASLYERYETEKQHRGLIDFDDLLWRVAETIEGDDAFAAGLRWRYRHLFVDEFQDVNPAQFRLLRAWLGGNTDLCAVGDDDQAIYGFSGADAGYLVDFGRWFPGAAVVRLEENYRSTPQILAAANAVLPGGMRTKQHLVAVRPDGQLPVVRSYSTDGDEARGIAAALAESHQRGVPWRDMAVLYRTNAQSAPFEAALRAAGVPCAVRGAARFLDRPEVGAALDELRRAEAGGGFAVALDALEAWAAAGTEERRAHADEVVRWGRQYLAETPAGAAVAGFVAYLTTTLAHEAPDVGGDAVDLLTFHKSKGLEWHTVFVCGLERGFVPIAYAETPAALAEERRLLYVALTRAEHELHLSWAGQRTLGARVQTRQPSPYLALVEAAISVMGPGGDRDWKAAVAAERARLALARAGARSNVQLGPPADPEVLAGLVEWRRHLARRSGVPAQVIFHDATLNAIAAACPRTREALLELPGVGPLKVERYGEALLDLVSRAAS
jgi:DNA helicase-2/ATP-dependent DNA helicase PcrA